MNSIKQVRVLMKSKRMWAWGRGRKFCKNKIIFSSKLTKLNPILPQDSETSSRSGQNSSDMSISKSIILPSSYRQHIPSEGVSERHLAAHRDRKFKFFPTRGSVLSIREFFCKDKEEPETAKLKREKSQFFLDLSFV